MTDWLVDEDLAPAVEGPLSPLYAAAAQGSLALPHCERCSQPLELEQVRCHICDATEIAWRTVEPVGTVHAATTVHRREPGLIIATQPYHVVDIELSSGHHLLMSTSEPAATPPAIGDHAQIVFRYVGGVPVPAMEVADPDQSPASFATADSRAAPTSSSDSQEATP